MRVKLKSSRPKYKYYVLTLRLHKSISFLKQDAKEFYSILKHVFIRLSMFISIFNLLALTFDRYLAITAPLKHRKRGRSFTYKVILGVWFFSVGCVTLIYCISRYKLSNVEKYNNMVFPISSYTTFAVFIFCYTLIYRTVRNSNNIGRNKAVDNYNMKKEVSGIILCCKNFIQNQMVPTLVFTE